MGEQFSKERAHSGAKKAGLAVAALMIAACVSDTAPQRTSAAADYAADHAVEGYLPRDMGAARRAVFAALGRDETAGLRYNASMSERAAIGEAEDPASAAHEADFAKTAPHDAGKLLNAPEDAPLNILVQNRMAPGAPAQGGWRDTGDAYIHDYSGMRCPKVLEMLLTGETEEEIESLSVSLSRISLFDETGQDTSCDYQDEETGIYFTLYASNWPEISREDHFASALKAMASRIPLQEAAPVLIANAEVEGPSSIEGETLGAAFITQPIGGVSYKTGLWLNKTGPWHVKARATFPADLAKGGGEISLVEMVAVTIHAVTLVEVDAYINAAQTVSFGGR